MLWIRLLRVNLICLTIVLVAGLAGCMGDWRPGVEHLAAPPTAANMELAQHLRAGRAGLWVYERRALPLDEEEPPMRYARRITAERISEGVLDERAFLPVETYLDPSGAPASQPADEDTERPRAPLEGGTAILFRLAEPLETVPLELETTGPLASETPISYFDYRGVLASNGTLRREVEVEGIEDVECPAGRFEGCLRVRVDLHIRFPWVSVTNLTSYLWLSPEVGEVRRVQRFSGWFLVFWFGSADEYQLVSYELAAKTASAKPLPPPEWACGALLLKGAFPHPRIVGMVIDMPTGSDRHE